MNVRARFAMIAEQGTATVKPVAAVPQEGLVKGGASVVIIGKLDPVEVEIQKNRPAAWSCVYQR